MQCCRLAHCDGGSRKGKSLYVHTTFQVCAHHSLRGLVVTEDIRLSHVLRTRTIKMARRNLLMGNGQTTADSSCGKISRSLLSSSLPALPSVSSDQFYDVMEATNPPTVQVAAASRRNSMQSHCMDQEDIENIFLRMESQESTRSKISQDVARSELEAMDRDARFCVIFYILNSTSQSGNTKDRQEMPEPSQNYEVMRESGVAYCDGGYWEESHCMSTSHSHTAHIRHSVVTPFTLSTTLADASVFSSLRSLYLLLDLRTPHKGACCGNLLTATCLSLSLRPQRSESAFSLARGLHASLLGFPVASGARVSSTPGPTVAVVRRRKHLASRSSVLSRQRRSCSPTRSQAPVTRRLFAHWACFIFPPSPPLLTPRLVWCCCFLCCVSFVVWTRPGSARSVQHADGLAIPPFLPIRGCLERVSRLARSPPCNGCTVPVCSRGMATHKFTSAFLISTALKCHPSARRTRRICHTTNIDRRLRGEAPSVPTRKFVFQRSPTAPAGRPPTQCSRCTRTELRFCACWTTMEPQAPSLAMCFGHICVRTRTTCQVTLNGAASIS